MGSHGGSASGGRVASHQMSRGSHQHHHQHHHNLSTTSSVSNDGDFTLVPLVSSISHVVLVVPDIETRDRTIDFYRLLKFQIVRRSPAAHSISSLNDLATTNDDDSTFAQTNSENAGGNVVLCFINDAQSTHPMFDLTPTINIEIRVNAKMTRNANTAFDEGEQTMLDAKLDASNGIGFWSRDIQTIESILAIGKHPIVKRRKEDIMELQVLDPAGNTLFFSSARVPFSRRPSVVERDIKIQPPISASPEPTGLRSDYTNQKPLKSIAVLTSGGDSPGMNAAVRAVVRWAIVKNCTPYCVYEGYQGLVDGGRAIKKLKWDDVQGILSHGGTAIGTARCKDFRERKGRMQAALNIIKNGINALVIIGGDGSLSGADVLRGEWSGLVQDLRADGKISDEEVEEFTHLTIVGLVGSIDNDMALTDLTIGAVSSLTRICEAVDSLASTAASHQRAFVVEVMGRHCGWLALMASIAVGADFLFIPERPPGDDWRDLLVKTVAKHRESGKRKNIIIISEGAIDNQLQPIKAEHIKSLLSDKLGVDTRVTTLGHVQRGGTPAAHDRFLATLQGIQAVESVLKATRDSPAVMIGIRETNIIEQPLQKAVELTRAVGEAISQRNFARAMELRDPEFQQAYDTWLASSRSELDYLDAQFIPSSKPVNNDTADEISGLGDAKRSLSPHFSAAPKSLRIGIIHVGAPAGGMNAATRVAVRFALNKGHTPIAIHNGFPGLMVGDVSDIGWMDVEDWISRGGSELGTNPDLPANDIGLCAYQLQKFNIQALLILGGFEAFTACWQLYSHRKEFPAFCIPITQIPCTISNNVPGTQYSIGSDTALNAITEACDRIKQSAASSRKRVFVMEVQGGRSGYLAAVGGLAGGATRTYIPEEPIRLEDLQTDIALLKKRYAISGNEGRVIIRNESVSTTYTTEVMSSILKEESEGLYDSKVALLGHLQQGGSPSPLDRTAAARLAVKCINWLEQHGCKSLEAYEEIMVAAHAGSVSGEEEVLNLAGKARRKVALSQSPNGGVYVTSPETCCVIGTRGTNVVFTPVEELVPEADMKKRVWKNPWWKGFSGLVRVLAKYGVNDGEDEVPFEVAGVA